MVAEKVVAKNGGNPPELVAGCAPGQILPSRTDFPTDRQILLSHTSPNTNHNHHICETKRRSN